MPARKTKTSEEILKKLPDLIQTDDAFRERLFGILLEHLPSRREFNEILEKIDDTIEEIRELNRRQDEHTKAIRELSQRQEEHSKAIHELSQRLEEHSKILERHSQVLEEHTKAIRELSQRQEEHSKAIHELSQRLEEHSKILERHSQVLEEHTKRLEEHSRAIESLVKEVHELKITVGGLVKEFGDMKIEFYKLADEVMKLKVTVGNIGARWGIMTEDMFRKAYTEIMKVLFGPEYKVEKRKIKYDGKESDLDIVIFDEKEIIVEISSSLNKKKAERIIEKVKAFREQTGKMVTAYVISASVSAEAVLLLSNENINVITPEFEEEI